METLNSEIMDFVKTLPDWGKYLANKLLAAQGLKEEDYSIAYKYFKEDSDLTEKQVRPSIIIETFSNPDISLKKDTILTAIKNLEGVNALIECQNIELSPNITVIYGANGSGKTGYIRLLNNAFFSRSNDKEIVPDIHLEAGHKTPACEFIFRGNGNTYTLKYPNDHKNIEFQQFAVFDCKSVLIHLNEKNEFVFRPKAMDFFGGLSSGFETLKGMLIDEIGNQSTPKDFTELFEGNSDIKTLIGEISFESEIDNFNKHTPFTDEDKNSRTNEEEKRIELEAIKKNKEGQIKNLETINKALKKLMLDIDSNNLFFTTKELTGIDDAILESKTKQEIAKQEGVDTFKTDKLKSVGSPEWKAFIEAAELFAKEQKEKYPDQDDHCLLCQQILKENELKLLANLWTFIKSKAEENARGAKAALQQVKERYKQLNFNLLPLGNVLTEWLNENYPEILQSLRSALQTQNDLCIKLLSDIEKEIFSENLQYQIETIKIRSIESELSTKIEELKGKNIDEEIRILNTNITYLHHKEKLEIHKKTIEDYLTRLKWAAKAETKKGDLNTASVTNAGKRLFKKYFGQVYSTKFAEECNVLNARFKIDLSHSGSYGNSYREFKIKDRLPKDRLPSQILSEGEQRAISLADFLAEIQQCEINRGIIFDDPVTSLDEERKSNIAKRLTSEAHHRQVIIFTHDLVFLSSILGHCEEQKIQFDCHWIEKLEGKPGIIWLRNTPSYEKAYKKSGKAQHYYEISLNCSPEQREINIKSGFAALRTSYESLVIFDLFGGVVQRFNERVSIESLSDVYFEKSITNEILDSFNQCCRYMEGHSHSDKYAYKKPERENLNEEIIRFNDLKTKLKNLKSMKA
jgi:energy-coupling factor transporter ATP-binding protein EcfA2